MIIEICLLFGVTLLIHLFNKAILFLQFKAARPSYDHYYHLNLIKGIELNKHMFTKNTPAYMTEKNFMYPQFYHWILSFFGARWVEKNCNTISNTISLLMTLTVLVFANWLHQYYFSTIPIVTFIISVGIVYWLTPFNFYLWNSKNRGLSVRGFGLLLGLWYQINLVWFALNPTIWLFASVVSVALIILLSSQFTFQFVLFSAPLFAHGYQNVWLLLVPLLAIIFYIVLLPQHAFRSIKGQYYHKKIWLFYLSEMMLKKTRYSIWRDLIYDIWKKKNIKYLLDNAIISVLIGIPALLVTVGLFCWKFYYIGTQISNIEKIIWIQVLVCLLLFILTSFRKTRFLGEPERYAEFAIPFITILLVINTWPNTWVLLLVIAFSFSAIAYHYALFGFQKIKTTEHILNVKIYILQQFTAEEYRIFSNNTFYLNYFIDDIRFKILQPDITSEFTGTFHFKEIFPKEYFIVNPPIILPLIIEFNIEFFILETDGLSENEFESFLSDSSNKVQKISSFDNLTLYKINR